MSSNRDAKKKALEKIEKGANRENKPTSSSYSSEEDADYKSLNNTFLTNTLLGDSFELSHVEETIVEIIETQETQKEDMSKPSLRREPRKNVKKFIGCSKQFQLVCKDHFTLDQIIVNLMPKLDEVDYTLTEETTFITFDDFTDFITKRGISGRSINDILHL